MLVVFISMNLSTPPKIPWVDVGLVDLAGIIAMFLVLLVFMAILILPLSKITKEVVTATEDWLEVRTRRGAVRVPWEAITSWTKTSATSIYGIYRISAPRRELRWTVSFGYRLAKDVAGEDRPDNAAYRQRARQLIRYISARTGLEPTAVRSKIGLNS
jgi:hypothetical protein